MNIELNLPGLEEQINSKSHIIAYKELNKGYKQLSYVVDFNTLRTYFVCRLVKQSERFEEVVREENSYDLNEAKLLFLSIDKANMKNLVDITGDESQFDKISKAKHRKTGEIYEVSLVYDKRGVDVLLYKEDWNHEEMDNLAISWRNEFDDEMFIPYKEEYNV